ncbi:hypothetical protein [Pseudidiomarina sp. CB1]|uniref:hypothetical protein n=1 Tax=Pseudidiomarina sp. CB1 TaxID=2972484 RepID=UPI0021620964|nr:hypothetical protein [Pseudidiomarina sp. CB1]
MDLLNQPFTGQLGDKLIELLESPDFEHLNIAVAFAKNSGVLRLKDFFNQFREKGGTVNIYVGVDLGVTSYEALTALLHCTDSLNVVHSETGQTFHTKIYQFLGKARGVIAIGSHNLTGGGLWTNFESSAHITLDMNCDEDIEIAKNLEDYFNCLSSLGDSFRPISSMDDIRKLLEDGYVAKEVSQRIHSVKTAGRKPDRVPLFGRGFPATMPQINIPDKKAAKKQPKKIEVQVSAKQDNVSDIIWFETRRLTGGSRNILDLSMKSLIEKGNPADTRFDLGEPNYMRGGVEFFGISPIATSQRKDITINFEGTDFAGNTILFPTGDNANGTWRLQIKGVSISGERITDVFRAKGEGSYLVNKIVTFERIKDNYYSLAVFPESELDNFKTASVILGRNGSTRSAKWLGLLYR